MSSKSARLAEIGGNLAQSIGATGPRLSGNTAPPRPVLGARGKQLLGYERLPIVAIRPDPDQPRKEFDDKSLLALGQDIQARGLQQPILVRRSDPGYVVICGERRYRASKMVGLTEIDAIIRSRALTPEELLVHQLVENLAREDPKATETAAGIQRLVEVFGYTQAQVAEILKLSQPQVSRSLRLMGLPAPVFDLVDSGELAASTAVEIAKQHKGDESAIVEEATKAVATKTTRATIAAKARPAKPDPELCTVHNLPVSGVITPDEVSSPESGTPTDSGESTVLPSLDAFPPGTPVKVLRGTYDQDTGIVFAHRDRVPRIAIKFDVEGFGSTYFEPGELEVITAEAPPKQREVITRPSNPRPVVESAEEETFEGDEPCWGVDSLPGYMVTVTGPDRAKFLDAIYAAARLWINHVNSAKGRS